MILSIYIGYVISGTILYAFFGMKIFDAVNHSMAALSTGGFSVLPNSIGQYDNIQIEIVTMILMIMGTTNFAAHLLLINGKFKQFFKVGEIRFLMVLIGIGVPILSFLGLSNLYDSADHLVRVGAFQFISALSTTGFSTVTFTEWGTFSKWMLIALMIIGGGAGSTAGGIKLYRVYIIFKTSYWRLLNRFKSPNTLKVQYVYKPEGKHFISSETLNEASSYAFIYVVLLFLGTGVLLLNGYSFEDSLFEYASALGTVGLSVGVTSIDTPAIVLLTEIVGMLFGRLEVYVIFVSIIRIVLNIRNRALLRLMDNEMRRQS
jgi:trk system potassium uptake protein TrkH